MRLSLGAITVCATSAWAEPVEIAGSGYLQPAAIALDQASVDALDPATRAPLNAERFIIRRGRVRVHAHTGRTYGSIELGANTVTSDPIRLIRALAGVRLGESESGWPLLDLHLGLMPTPFGGALQRSSRTRPFIERSLAERALFPGTHDLGAQARGQWRFVRYQLAAMNGSPIGAAEQPGTDPTAAKDLMGRLATRFEFDGAMYLEVGTSLIVGEGFSPGTASTKDQVQWQDANQNGAVEISELTPIAGVAGRPPETFDREALGLDLDARVHIPGVGPMTVFGELYWARNLDRGLLVADPTGTGRDLREVGLQAGFWLGIRDVALVGVRWDHYDPDADANERIATDLVPLDRSITTLSGVLGWTGWDPLQLFVQYDYEDNQRGRGLDGSPARLEADRLTIWAQVAR